MSRLTTTTKTLFMPVIFILYLFGVDKYVGEDSFIEYWKNFDES